MIKRFQEEVYDDIKWSPLVKINSIVTKSEKKIIEKPSLEYYEKIFQYIKKYGVDDLINFAYEDEEFEYKDRIHLIYNDFFHPWAFFAVKEEQFLNILKKYPRLYEYLKNNNMLNHTELLNESYYDYFSYFKIYGNAQKALENIKALEKLDVETAFLFIDSRNCYNSEVTHAIYDITDEEKLVQLLKTYCDIKLSYHLIDQEIFEKDGRIYRHEKYHTQYDYSDKDLIEMVKRDLPDYDVRTVELSERPWHTWEMKVLNDGENIKTHLAFSRISFMDKDSLPEKEEINAMRLPKELEDYRKVLKLEGKIKDA